MTSSANDDWNHYELVMAVHLIEKDIRRLKECSFHGQISNAATLDIKSLEHAIDFIRYNIEQSEITDNNGD